MSEDSKAMEEHPGVSRMRWRSGLMDKKSCLIEWEQKWIADEEFMDSPDSRTHLRECGKVFDDMISAQKHSEKLDNTGGL